MSSELRDRMLRGEATTALALDAQAPLGAVVRSIKRRRAVRATTTAALGVVAVAGAAIGASAVIGGQSTLPAGPLSGDPSTATESSTAAPTEQALAIVPDGSASGAPVLPATEAAARATFVVKEAPDVEIGTLRPIADLGAVVTALCTADPCERPDLPAATEAVIASMDSTWAIAAQTVSLYDQEQGFSSLVAVEAIDPEGKAYTLLDLTAWAQDAGLGSVGFDDAAFDPDARRLMLNVTSDQGGRQTVVLVDLTSGATHTLTADGFTNGQVGWDGKQWWVTGQQVNEGAVAASLSPDGSEWSVDGRWTADAGSVALIGDAGLITWPDVATSVYADGKGVSAVPDGLEWCNPVKATLASLTSVCFDAKGDGHPWVLDLDTLDWAPSTALATIPGGVAGSIGDIEALGGGLLVQTTSSAAQGEGYTWYIDGQQRSIAAPAGGFNGWVIPTGARVWLAYGSGIG
ncbi:MAG: hypothetical protein HGA51_01465, partial [Demequinaceae bacterium]|nr:hypothetical protein [Demequinaceae bacterium]